jgi:hypothetical protein
LPTDGNSAKAYEKIGAEKAARDSAIATEKAAMNGALRHIQDFEQGAGPAYDMHANVGEHFPGSRADCQPGDFVTGLKKAY